MHTTKGQIGIAIVGAISAVIVSMFSAFGISSNRVGEIDTKVQIVDTREQAHFDEVAKRLDRMELKLDRLIDQQITKTNTKK